MPMTTGPHYQKNILPGCKEIHPMNLDFALVSNGNFEPDTAGKKAGEGQQQWISESGPGAIPGLPGCPECGVISA